MPAAQTVLVVDDDPQILRLVQKMLGPRGINLLAAPQPSEALLICQREPIHLLISDIAMPGMNGNILAERVLKLHPNASILLISGHYKEAPAAPRGDRVKFLRKPFFPSQLVELLLELLPEAHL